MGVPRDILDYRIITEPAELPECDVQTGALRNSLLAGRHFFTVMQGGIDGDCTYYIVLYSGDRIAAKVCVTEITVAIGVSRARFAICGNPIVSADCAIFTSVDFDREPILPLVLRSITAIMDRRNVHALLLREIDAPEHLLHAQDFFRLPLEPVLALHVDAWRSFSDYTLSMRAHYRGLLRRADRELSDQGFSLKCEHEPVPLATDLYDLLTTVSNHPAESMVSKNSGAWADKIVSMLTNLPRRRLMIRPEFFSLLHQELPQETDVITLRQDNRIIGFTINLHDGDIFHSIYIGIKRDSHTPFVYRKLLGAKIERAFERGARLIHFGRT